MKALHEAILTANRCGIPNFEEMVREHMNDGGYVICTPNTFICAMETWKDYDKEHAEPGWFVTIAVGDLAELFRLDPRPEIRKWICFERKHGGRLHWVDYQRLRKKILRLPDSQK